MSQWSNWATKILKTKYNSMIIFWKFLSPPTERREICETTAFSSIFHQMCYHFSKLSLIRIWYELKYFQTGVVAVILVWLEQYPCSNVYDMTSDRDIWTISDNSYRTLVWYATIWFDVNPWWLQLLLMDKSSLRRINYLWVIQCCFDERPPAKENSGKRKAFYNKSEQQ